MSELHGLTFVKEIYPGYWRKKNLFDIFWEDQLHTPSEICL